jgi:hypothetical protein
MIEPTWQVAVFVAFRVASALPTLRWPFAGALIALVADFADLFLMDAIGGISDYQRLDKLCDLAYIATFLIVALRWSGLERAIALVLFAYRMIGEVAFELSGERALLLLFPNVFEFWFVAVAARRHYRPDRTHRAAGRRGARDPADRQGGAGIFPARRPLPGSVQRIRRGRRRLAHDQRPVVSARGENP